VGSGVRFIHPSDEDGRDNTDAAADTLLLLLLSSRSLLDADADADSDADSDSDADADTDADTDDGCVDINDALYSDTDAL